MTGIFIIMNEWHAIDDSAGSEVVGGNYFESESEAWEALEIIAEAHDTRLHLDDTSIQFEDPTPHLMFEEFYIQELNKL